MTKFDVFFLVLVSCCFIPACKPKAVEVERWNDPVVIKTDCDCKCGSAACTCSPQDVVLPPAVEEPSVPKPETPAVPPAAVVPPTAAPVCVDGNCSSGEVRSFRPFRGFFRRR